MNIALCAVSYPLSTGYMFQYLIISNGSESRQRQIKNASVFIQSSETLQLLIAAEQHDMVHLFFAPRLSY